MIDVVCFKHGEFYSALWVNRLACMLKTHLLTPHTFVCFTDDPTGVAADCQPLPDPTWKGWWSKLSFFRPRERRTICLDLDTVIVARCDFLADYAGPFALLRDFYRLGQNYGSAIMSLQAGEYGYPVWEDFSFPPPSSLNGDQEYIQEKLPHADFWQDLYPGRIVSYKVHCERRGAVPTDAAIVCMHGKPRLTDLPKHHILRQAWESYA